MRAIKVHFVPLVALAALAACAGESPDRSGPEAARVAVSVAPLTLPGVGQICYDLRVTNAADGAGETVWSKGTPGTVDADALCSTSFGNGQGGDITYIGTCDASEAPRTNSVTLWVDSVYDDGMDLVDPNGAEAWQDPCPTGCTLDVVCLENQDVLVEFNLTIMREANQGFFDVAVNFEDIFCSAKVDCVDSDNQPLALLFYNGVRDTTVVSALACTTGPGGAATELYRDDLVVTCSGQAPVVLDPSVGKGNAYPTLATDTLGDAVWQYAIYAGEEALSCDGQPCNKHYWNVAIGLDATLDNCVLTTRMTAAESGSIVGFATPAAHTYPYIDVNVPLTDGAGLTCTKHPLNNGNGVATTYTEVDAPETFDALLTSQNGQDTFLRFSNCSPNPCLNGGTCADTAGSYTCTCASGYTGTNCADETDECSPNPCQNGGICTDGVASFTCACVGGWEGTTCTEPPPPYTLSMLGQGGDQLCAVRRADNAAYCWGAGGSGNLGNGGTSNASVATLVSGGLQWKQLSATGVNSPYETCGVTTAGVPYCWGYNGFGQLGDGSTNNASVPVAVAGGHTFTSITESHLGGCGLEADGTAWCWTRYEGNGNNGGTGNVPVAVTMPTGKTFVSVSRGSGFVHALTTDGLLYTWGSNSWGQLAMPGGEVLVPTYAAVGRVFSAVTAAHYGGCGIEKDTNDLYCWGYNGFGTLGIGSTSPGTSDTPLLVVGGLKWKSFWPGPVHNCGITLDGDAYCWGQNTHNQIDSGTAAWDASGLRTSPVLIAGGYKWASLTTSNYATCGVTKAPDSKVRCWGGNAVGEIGNGTMGATNVTTPTVVQGLPY